MELTQILQKEQAEKEEIEKLKAQVGEDLSKRKAELDAKLAKEAISQAEKAKLFAYQEKRTKQEEERIDKKLASDLQKTEECFERNKSKAVSLVLEGLLK